MNLIAAIRGTGPYAACKRPLSWRLGLEWSMFEHRLKNFGGWPERWWSWPVRKLGWAIYKTRRCLGGARKVAGGETEGSFSAVDCELDFSGMCPVQGDGWVTDHKGERRECYYRSRGEGWQFHVAPLGGAVFDDGEWVYSESNYFFPEGGYVSANVSIACIEKALDLWRQECLKRAAINCLQDNLRVDVKKTGGGVRLEFSLLNDCVLSERKRGRK